jgi:hypothetical protein
VHRGVPGLGIGVAEIGGDPKLTPPPDLSGPELAVLDQVLLDRALLDGALGDAAEPRADRLVWLARFAAAKEAAAKAEGAGPEGAASPPVITAATSSVITMNGAGGRFEVSHRVISNPPELAARRYAVAWT